MDTYEKRPTLRLQKEHDQELAENLRKIDKKDWWIWANSIFVMLLLTGALISFALPSLRQGATAVFHIKFSEAIIGLVCFVVLFNVYALHQQVLIKRLRRELAEKQAHAMVLRELAMIDALTGLYNRRFAEQRLASEVARSARKGYPFSVVLLDLDEFKYINDTFGHSAGDLALRQFAAALTHAIREGDLAVRLGGDEFLLILPECGSAQLQLVVDRIGAIEMSWRDRKIPVRYSTGFKEYVPGDNPESMLAGADAALYNNKRAAKTAPSASAVLA